MANKKVDFDDNAKDIIKMLGGWEKHLDKEKNIVGMRKFNKLLQELLEQPEFGNYMFHGSFRQSKQEVDRYNLPYEEIEKHLLHSMSLELSHLILDKKSFIKNEDIGDYIEYRTRLLVLAPGELTKLISQFILCLSFDDFMEIKLTKFNKRNKP